MPLAVLLLLIALACAAVALLLKVLVEMAWQPVADVDEGVLLTSHSFASKFPVLVFLLKVISSVAVPVVYRGMAFIVATGLVWRRRPITALYLVVAILIGLRLAPLLKAAIRRTRPQFSDPLAGAGGYSFPSGHSLSVTVTVLALLVVALPLIDSRTCRTTTIAVLGLLVIVVCTARVVLGVHYLTDVVAGLFIGSSWVALWTAIAYSPMAWEKSRRRSQELQRVA